MTETDEDFQFYVMQEKYPAKLLELSDVVQPGKAAGERRENVIPEVGKGLYHAYPAKNIVPDAKQRYENMLRHLRA